MCNPCCAVLSFRPRLGFHPLMVRVERLSPLNVFWMLVWAMFWKGWSVCFSLLLNPPLHQVVLWCLPPATQRPPACKTRSYAGHLQQPHRTICAHLLWVSSPGSMVHVLVLRLWRSPSTPHSSPLPQALHSRSLAAYELECPAAVQMVLFFSFLSSVNMPLQVSLQVCFGGALVSNAWLWAPTLSGGKSPHCSLCPASPPPPTQFLVHRDTHLLLKPSYVSFMSVSLPVLSTTG